MQIYGVMTRLVSPNQKIFVEAEVYALGDKPPFGNAPNLGHSNRSLPFLKPVVRLLSTSDSPKDRVWDEAAIPALVRE